MRVWEGLGMFRRVWEDMGGFGRFWKGLGGFGRVWDDLGRFEGGQGGLGWEGLVGFRDRFEIIFG